MIHNIESGRLSPQCCRLDFLPAASGCEFLGRAIGPAQEPWDELVHARGRPQIDEPGQDVDEICLRIDSGQLAVPTSSTMWVSSSILDAAIIKDLGKLDGSPKRVPRTTSSRGGGWLAQGTGVAGSGPCHCATNVCGWLEGL